MINTIKRIQETRKKSGFKVADRINITLAGSADVLEAASEHKAYIRDETLGLELTIADSATELESKCRENEKARPCSRA